MTDNEWPVLEDTSLEYIVVALAMGLEHDVVSWTRFDGAKRPFV